MATDKQKQNRKKFTRDYKVREIQKNITKRTRLKKNYFKALKSEGYSVPEKSNNASRERKSSKQYKEEQRNHAKDKLQSAKQDKLQRIKDQKQKREQKRFEQLEKIKISKDKYQQRGKKSERLTQKTRTGQPLMGPRIENLLDKIKNDDTYTN